MLVKFSNETPTNILKWVWYYRNPELTGGFYASEINLSLAETEKELRQPWSTINHLQKCRIIISPQTFPLSTRANKNVPLKKS